MDLFRAFRVEQTDPDHFYRIQAADAVAQLRRYAPVDGRLVVDVGGGGGYFTEAFVAAGARCVLVEPDRPLHPTPPGQSAAARRLGATRTRPGAEAARRERHRRAVRPGRLAPGRTVAGDGNRLPLPDAVADVVFSSNVLEHVPDPGRFLDEMVRVTPTRRHRSTCRSRRGTPRGGATKRLRGTIWVASEPPAATSGATAALPATASGRRSSPATWARACEWPVRIPAWTIVDALPRYYPDWMRWLVAVPVVREVATWNLLLVLRRRGTAP